MGDVRTIPPDDLQSWIETRGDEYLVTTVFEFLVFDVLQDFDHFKTASPFLRTCAPGMTAVFRVWRMESEVVNGGFLQFFDNNGMDLARDTIADCRQVGLSERAKILKDAISLFESGVGAPDDRRWLVVDNRFYDEQDNLEAAPLLADFIRNNTELFSELPLVDDV
jgi:hypothetical protein